MTISREEALDAVQQLERTQARLYDARAYRNAGGQLILWGVIWAVGYTLSGVWPARLAIIWPPLVLLGMVAGLVIARRSKTSGPALAPWRWTAQALAIGLFIYGAYFIFPITSTAQPLAFPALMIAFIYALVGSARLTRMLWIGAALFVATIFGLAFLKPYIAFWLAAAGGGALIAGGLWLRGA